ncbi:MAG: lysozyme [Shimia sp.]
MDRDVSLKCERITARMCLELLHHEAIVTRAYRDAGDVWTWGVGLTAASGVDPLIWEDHTASLEDCLSAFATCLASRYLPEVLAVTGPLPEHQLAAAVSFHWNTGAIARASWVAALPDVDAAAEAMLEWNKPACIQGRRAAEARLLRDGLWSHTGMIKVFGGVTEDARPDPATLRLVDLRGALSKPLP